LRSDLYRAPIRGIELLKGAAPTHLELNRQCATELPGTIPNVRGRRKPPLLIVFPVSHLGARFLPTNPLFLVLFVGHKPLLANWNTSWPNNGDKSLL
jgi:hypothetical protein